MKRRICFTWRVESVARFLETNNLLTERQRTEVTAALEDARARGFDVVPACDNHDERGACRGHVILEENERP